MSQNKTRLDITLVNLGFATTRSQAENYIKLSKVQVNGQIITKSGFLTSRTDKILLNVENKYVGRAALKLESVADTLGLNFKDKLVLDIGSSTGGFTDFALQNGAKKIIAIELGKDQMNPKLIENSKVELHEKTDILDVLPADSTKTGLKLSFEPDIVLLDLSFISLREILPHVVGLVGKNGNVVAMVKPQFEAKLSGLKHKGVIKNERIRRQIFKDFEVWVKDYFVVINKADSKVSGSNGNLERFYLLNKLQVASYNNK